MFTSAHRRRFVLMVAALSLVPASIYGAEPETAGQQDLSHLLKPIIQRHKVPGMVAGLIEGEELTATGASGVRSRGGSEQVTLGDRFHVGSCTKAMTAALCGLLVDQGKLSWDLTLAEAFPELKETMRAEYRSITLEQLLAHRSGITNDVLGNGLMLIMRLHMGEPRQTRAQLVKHLVTCPLEAEPDSKFIYCNTGYILAGHMAERATDRSWEELMREHIFQPLQMHSAGFGAPGSAETVDQPRGHLPGAEGVEPGWFADNPPAMGPAGTVHSSLGDWARFVAWQLQGARDNQQRLRPETMKKLHTPRGDGSYALGWGVAERSWAEGTTLSHGGSNGFWNAVVWVAPSRNFAVLVACNQGGDEAAKACDEAASAIIDWHLR